MADKRKIAFLCHPYHRGGVTRWMADAAIALSKNGHEVYFVTVEPIREFFSAKGRETMLKLLSKEKNTVNIIKVPVSYEFEFGTAEYRSYVYKKLIVQLPPGIPIVLSDDHAVWEAATSLYESYPVVGVLHADENQYYELAEQYYRKVDVFVCVSTRVNKTARERVPQFEAAHVFTIPCGIKLPSIEFKGPGDILQLVYVGRVSNYQKRASDQAKICALLAQRNIPFHLNVIGDGDAKTSLENALLESGLQKYVTFYGWLSQKQVAVHLSESDILLLTSDFEGTPIAMMEAFATGCAVVGTRVSGIEDYENHPLAGDCLGVYTVGDIEDAVDKINKVAAVPPQVRHESARKIAEAEFSMKVCLERYLIALATIRPRTTKPPKIHMRGFERIYSRARAFARNAKMERRRKK